MNKLDRRKQPSTTIKTIGAVVPELNWTVKEVANNNFVRPSGKINESYGYNLVIPKDLSYLHRLWVGYMNHEDALPGIYSCIDYNFCKPRLRTATDGQAKFHDPLDYGYGEAPFEFFLIYKKILLLEEVEKMEQEFGQIELKKRIKSILKKIYPFSIK